jgi:hypothetical protein
MNPEHSFVHVIRGEEVERERQKIISALLVGGYDPQDLALDYPAAQRLVSQICDEAYERGVPMAEPNWVLNVDGDVEVGLGFGTVSEMILIKLAIS